MCCYYVLFVSVRLKGLYVLLLCFILVSEIKGLVCAAIMSVAMWSCFCQHPAALIHAHTHKHTHTHTLATVEFPCMCTFLQVTS